ncbi:MAG: transcriptional regulator [Methanomassiliicoccaceae archaeon]|jgi:predicted transcriptional regulator|nr:transcriptional regulator [Methanomassiliicoccaceae archaeon]
MRLPCETIIVEILPIMRKKLALDLIETHRMRKADVARLFGVSGTAISQYVYGMRGNNSLLEDSPHYERFVKEISLSAEKVAEKKSNVTDELCRLCDLVKCIGMVDGIYDNKKGYIPVIKCAECPRSG